MAQAVRIVGHLSDRDENEQLQAQVDELGNLYVREGAYPGLNFTYERTSFVAGDSPSTHDFFTDSGGKYASDGYIICDGDGDIQVDITRNGIIYGSKWTMKAGEKVALLRLDIKKIRITHTGADSSYRINLI
jgi:hypothetical protein